MKSYLYRVYNGGSLAQTWGGDSMSQVPVTSDPSFSAEVDGGLSPLTISLALPFDYTGTDLTLGNTVETWCTRDDGTTAMLHAGFLETIEDDVSDGAQATTVTVTPYLKQLGSDYFRDDDTGTTIAHTWTSTDVSTILSTIISKSIVRAGTFSRVHTTASSIQTSGKTISIQVGSETYLDAIRRVKGMGPGDWYWYVDAAGVFWYRNFDSGTKHVLTLGREIKRLSRTQDIQELKNTVDFWNSADALDSVLALERPAALSASQTAYGRRVEQITDSRIDDADTAKSLADRFIREREQPLVTISVDVLSDANDPRGYDIESIKPGDTCEVRNLPSLAGQALSITRVDYRPDGVSLTLANGPVHRSWSLGKQLEEMYLYVKTFQDGSIPTDTNA